MSKFHISPDGEPRACTAKEGGCKYGADYPHFSTAEDARQAFELSEGLNKTFAAIRRTTKAATKAEERKAAKAEAERIQREEEALVRARLDALSAEYSENPNFEAGVTGEVLNLEDGRGARAKVFEQDAVKTLINLVALKAGGGDRSNIQVNADETNNNWEDIDGYISLAPDFEENNPAAQELAEDIAGFAERHFPALSLETSNEDYYGNTVGFYWKFSTDLEAD